MKIKEYKNKIIIAELDKDCDYLIIANSDLVSYETLISALSVYKDRKFGIIGTSDVDKAVRFVEIPKKGKDDEEHIDK